jgi:hypothetical protein
MKWFKGTPRNQTRHEIDEDNPDFYVGLIGMLVWLKNAG